MRQRPLMGVHADYIRIPCIMSISQSAKTDNKKISTINYSIIINIAIIIIIIYKL